MAELNRILLVDDEPDIQEVARTALEIVGGFTVITAGSGEQALELALSEQFDLVLLDVMMPDMDGPQVLARLKQNAKTRDLPVVFLTAKVQSHEVQEYLRLGAADVLSKPFDPMALPADVRRIWENALAAD